MKKKVRRQNNQKLEMKLRRFPKKKQSNRRYLTCYLHKLKNRTSKPQLAKKLKEFIKRATKVNRHSKPAI